MEHAVAVAVAATPRWAPAFSRHPWSFLESGLAVGIARNGAPNRRVGHAVPAGRIRSGAARQGPPNLVNGPPKAFGLAQSGLGARSGDPSVSRPLGPPETAPG